jgi:hypothetical protein
VRYHRRVIRLPDKSKVRDALVATLSEQLAHAAHVAQTTREGATHEEAKPENDKDTRALEQSYLARGQAMRAEALVEQVQLLRFMSLPVLGAEDPIQAGALVLLESDDGERCVFVAPYGGGTDVTVDGVEVQVVTPTSPLGKSLLGRVQDDELELVVRGGKREYTVASVR